MKTLTSLFPLGTLRGTIACFVIGAYYGILTSFVTLIDVLKYRQKFFHVKERTQRPKCLTDETLGEHNYIQCKNVKLHYISKGDPNKPLMLFLHGFPELWYSWRHQLKEFSQNYFTVAISMRGYGDSDKPEGVANYSIDKLVEDVRDVVIGLGKQNCILVGHDWGGIVGWMTAAHYPELVDRFIVCNAPNYKAFTQTIATNWRQFLMSWYVFLFNMPYLPELRFRSNDLQLLDIMFKKLTNVTKDDIEAYKYHFSKPGAFTGPMNYYRAIQRGYGQDLWDKAVNKRITCPTLVIWGKHDLALTSTLAADSCKSCDRYVIKMIDNCSHWTPMDKPDVVNKYMTQFLAQKFA